MDSITHIFQFDMNSHLERVIVVSSLNSERSPQIRVVFTISCED
jgi:hypothetical protein